MFRIFNVTVFQCNTSAFKISKCFHIESSQLHSCIYQLTIVVLILKGDAVMKKVLIGSVHFYQKYISPMSPPTCRFYPTCSNYALEALAEHGAMKGSFMAAKRISKCHPFHEGGFDPVPVNEKKKHQ